MKTATRIYRVNDTLIRAATPAAATHHLVKRTISCRVATQEDILELRDMGLEIQEAGTEWKESKVPVVPTHPDPTDKELCNPLIQESIEHPGLRITLANEHTAPEFAEVHVASEDPAVLGAADDPAVLVTDEPNGKQCPVVTCDEIDDDPEESDMTERLLEFERAECHADLEEHPAADGHHPV